MFSKVIVVLATVAVISAQEAARFPAGVDPSRCPNFPICDNAALHNGNQYNPAPYSAPQPQYYNPAPAPQYYNPSPYSAPQYSAPAYQPQYQQPSYQPQAQNYIAAPAPSGGDKYPAGVNPQTCPNYPYCDVNAGHSAAPQVAPLPGFTERQYPAGVSPHSCPNFPYCN